MDLKNIDVDDLLDSIDRKKNEAIKDLELLSSQIQRAILDGGRALAVLEEAQNKPLMVGVEALFAREFTIIGEPGMSLADMQLESRTTNYSIVLSEYRGHNERYLGPGRYRAVLILTKVESRD